MMQRVLQTWRAGRDEPDGEIGHLDVAESGRKVGKQKGAWPGEVRRGEGVLDCHGDEEPRVCVSNKRHSSTFSPLLLTSFLHSVNIKK